MTKQSDICHLYPFCLLVQCSYSAYLCIVFSKMTLNNLNTKYSLKGLFLLVLYILVLMESALHTHECNGEETVCQECLAHVEHNAHVSQASAMDLDCMLCKIIHTTYISPETLNLSATLFLICSLATFSIYEVVKRKFSLPSLRAPPVI